MDLNILWFPVILVVAVLSFLLVFRLIIHRERMEMIRKGMMPDTIESKFPSAPHSRVYIGAITTGVGAGLFLGLLTLGSGPQLVVGLVPLCAGLAILLVHLLSKEGR